MDDLSGEENAWERARWDHLLEMYIPVRERGSDRIMAVAEFYMPPRRDRPAGARRSTDDLAPRDAGYLQSAVLLYGIVKRGSDTIQRQEVALTRQVVELTGPPDGERGPQRAGQLGSAAHHDAERADDAQGQLGPARRARADAIAGHPAPGRLRCARLPDDSPTAAELAEVEVVLREAMTDMRSVAAGLRVPELAPLEVGAVAARAVHDHERRSGRHVTLTVDGTFRRPSRCRSRSPSSGHSRRASRMRRATAAARPSARHYPPARLTVRALAPGLELIVSDDGAGFDPAALSTSGGLGLAGIREQAEILGGTLRCQFGTAGGHAAACMVARPGPRGRGMIASLATSSPRP